MADPANPPAAETKKGKKAEDRSPALRIVSRVDGFRRAGVAHPSAPVEHEAGKFSLDEFEALKAEPKLVIEIL